MTRVRILQAVSGLDFSWAPGDIIEMDDDQAKAWADGYRAEHADHTPTPPPPAPDQEPDHPDPDPGPAEGEAFDPDAHTVKDVMTHLDNADEAETLRVLDAEQAGQNRKGITSQREALLQAARRRAGATSPPAEVTADASRGGGRGDQPETR